MSNPLQQIANAIYRGDDEEVVHLANLAINNNVPVEEILSDGLIAGMDQVGCDFKAGDLFVPEVLVAANAMHAGMQLLRPLLGENGDTGLGRIVIGTVAGDLHDIGKNLVRMMLEGAGFETIDLGTDVSVDTFVEAVRNHKPQLVGMSALLTTTMVQMKSVIDALEEAGLSDSVKILIGGAPVTEDFAKHIGANGYAPDAAMAVDLARQLVNQTER